MENKYRERREKRYEIMHFSYHIAMSSIFILIAIVFFLAPILGLATTIQLNNTYRYAFATLCFVYGVFRSYRTLKK